MSNPTRPLSIRALAALFKELHKASLAPLAIELFDWLRELPAGHEYNPLLDVYTYTTMIVSPLPWLERPLAGLVWLASSSSSSSYRLPKRTRAV
jgi:hypothetical protein